MQTKNKVIGFYIPKSDTYGVQRNMPFLCEEYDENLYRMKCENYTFFIQKKELNGYKKCPKSLIQQRVDELEEKLDLYRKYEQN